MRVILAGGPAPLEREMAAAIVAATVAVVDQVGKDTLPQLLALLARATALLTPDSGPAHMATMVDTPVLGLYAATNPARSGPYRARQWCVDRYAEAARRFLGRDPADLPWTDQDRGTGRDGPDHARPTSRRTPRCTCWRARQVTGVRTPASPAPEPRMTDVLVPVSPGELLDKITILRIKAARMTDPAEAANVQRRTRAARAHLARLVAWRGRS
jgi:hypothetical protein